jgi:hypothetical protein
MIRYHVAAGSAFEFKIFLSKYGSLTPSGDRWFYHNDLSRSLFGWTESYMVLTGSIMNKPGFDSFMDECSERKVTLIDLTEELHGHGRISAIPRGLK